MSLEGSNIPHRRAWNGGTWHQFGTKAALRRRERRTNGRRKLVAATGLDGIACWPEVDFEGIGLAALVVLKPRVEVGL
jgi:hypothetical protein